MYVASVGTRRCVACQKVHIFARLYANRARLWNFEGRHSVSVAIFYDARKVLLNLMTSI